MTGMTASLLRCLSTVAVGLLSLTMASCNSTKKSGDYSGVIDYTTPETKLSQDEYPFDENGNYLSDVVSGKKKGSRNKKVAPPTAPEEIYTTPPAPVVASNTNYETPPTSTSPTEDPYAPVYTSDGGSSASSRSSSSTSTAKRQTTSSSRPKPKPVAKPKPKPVVKAKPKPAPKPKPKPQASTVSYTIRKGDTLYSLANRNGTTVSAIKKASGLSTDKLRDGQTIKIPRR